MDTNRKISLYCLAGWGQPANALEALSAGLSNIGEVKVNSTGALFSSAKPEVRSADEPSLYAEALLESIKSLAPPRALVAWSMGGVVALESMGLGLAEELDKLILVNTTARFVCGDDFPHGVLKADVSTLRAGIRVKPEAALRAFFGLVYDSVSKQQIDLNQRVTEALEDGVDCLIDGIDYLERADYRALLPKLDLPVMLVHASADGIMPPACGDYLAQNIKGSKLVVVPDADHGFVRDRSELVVDEVEGFLALPL